MVMNKLPMKTYTVPIWLEEISYQKRWNETWQNYQKVIWFLSIL